MPDPTGTITVDNDSTDINAQGFDPNERVRTHVEWYDTTGRTMLNVDGHAKSKQDGSVSITLSIGSDFLNSLTGHTYASAKARVWDELLEIHT